MLATAKFPHLTFPILSFVYQDAYEVGNAAIAGLYCCVWFVLLSGVKARLPSMVLVGPMFAVRKGKELYG